MSLERFQHRIRAASLSKAEATWFPRWVDGYRQHCRLDGLTDLPVNESLVIGFLRSLRDHRVAAWQRLQAARAIELYQEIIPQTQQLDFRPIKQKLSVRSICPMHWFGNTPTPIVISDGSIYSPHVKEAVIRGVA